MDRRRYLLGMLVAVALPMQLPAQIRANAAFNTERIAAGDTFNLRVLVAGAKVAPKRVSFAAWLPVLPTENILRRSEWARSGAQWVQQFTLIAFDSARLELPPLTVQLHLGDTVQTNPLPLLVTTPGGATDLPDMAGIRPIRREPTHWSDYWPWALGGALVLAFSVWLSRRNRRQRPPPVAQTPAPPLVAPRDWALEQLAALARAEAPALPFFARLSLIVREYLERRYRIPALESTTGEIARFLKKTDFPATQKSTLDTLLQQADLVKYAEMQPTAADAKQALEQARVLIQNS
ncbi:MAG: hypothetical protein JNK89_00695 [Saprospiraceae bacterium]|nr:hypothetical protein [Saprospiraceae bacterium]